MSEELSPKELRQSLIKSITDFERNFRKQFPLLWFATFAGPGLLTIAILTGMGLTSGWDLPRNYLTAAFATFFAFGRFIILVGTDSQTLAESSGWVAELGMTPGQLFGMLTCLLYTSPSPRDRTRSRMPSSA